ncbi:hypothetical protein K6119_01665 [Paracrocinitomix mangrovi]|uniref:ATP-grasp domain-containing protein n=1 Tax=Paracrocinitomix mangrovi TaxID=2862509 RepID=UPI001C8EEFE8|nr:hypothetical protein [Paracrocinitomix mangrovi]UKN02224.1 hypothetical protein K6119_01665 [Paracrocinitomix mangrovi]
MAKIALLTEQKYLQPIDIDWYVQQVLDEDGLVQAALENLGHKVIKVDWSDNSIDWESFDAAIFRTIWDYFHRYDEFTEFLRNVEGKTIFFNPINQIKWNVDKHYLGELKQSGVNIVESYYIEKGDKRSLLDIHKATAWTKTVIKPCVSGAARHTEKLDISKGDGEKFEAFFRKIISEESMILQPYQESITDKGEVSHVVINGDYTHSVHKLAKAGDYRVQDDFGGTIHDYTANEDEITFAESVVKSISPTPLYARIDVIWDNNGQLAVSELEMIEPELWFRKNPDAAVKMAFAINERLKKELF